MTNRFRLTQHASSRCGSGPRGASSAAFTLITRAFTLVELLVVVAIIAIMAAILFPVFAQAREKARQTTCLSNLRQLGNAVHLYLHDYDETFPLDAHEREEADSWVYALDPYTKNRQGATTIYRCPSDNTADTAALAWAPPPPGFTGAVKFTSYGTNAWMTPEDAYGGGGFTTVASVVSPANTIYSAEMSDGSASDREHFHASWWTPGSPSYSNPGRDGANSGLAVKRHQEGANYFFCDGHVKWLRWPQTWTPDGRTDLYDPRR